MAQKSGKATVDTLSTVGTCLRATPTEFRVESVLKEGKRWLQLALVLLVTVAVTTVASHLVVGSLGIRTGAIGYKLLAIGKSPPFALAEGSSLMIDGLSWKRIGEKFSQGIETWFVAGSSPSEWAVLQRRASNAPLNFIVVSAYDLNENFLCDYRAAVVPLDESIKDLWQSGADWPFAKRVLSQYPLRYLRYFFPTAGRSDGVMVGVREMLEKSLRPWVKIEDEAGPVVAAGADPGSEATETGKVSDWSKARVLRRMALMRSACQGKQSFDGPKKLAFLRMLQRARRQGRVIVVVLPVSPMYSKAFLTTEASQQFEASLSDLEHRVPEANWVHLEKLPALNSNELFWDFVHMNADGQEIATRAFLSEIQARPIASARRGPGRTSLLLP